MDSYVTSMEGSNFGIGTDDWNSMSNYEKSSCLNRLQNYNVMKALGKFKTIS